MFTWILIGINKIKRKAVVEYKKKTITNETKMLLWKWLVDFNSMSTHHGGARGVMVIVAGYGHGDTSSNPGPDWLHFT